MKLLAGVAALALVLGGCAVGHGTAADHSHDAAAVVKPIQSDSPFKGAWLDRPYSLPTAKLVDTAGELYSWPQDRLPAPVVVLFFGYTNCDDGFCQTQTADAAAAVRGLPAALAKQVRVVFITTDPARDTPEVLRAFLDQYSRDIIGLTGQFAQIQSAANALGVELGQPTAPATANYEVEHGTQLIGFGPDGRAPVVWLPGTPLADIRADLAVLASGKY